MEKISRLRAYVEKRWYGSPGALVLLSPLAWTFAKISRRRRALQTQKAHRCDVPLVVVGNISVGGTGKTPTLIALVKFLQSQGMTPGVVSRGYGRTEQDHRLVSPCSLSSEVGDEPLMIYRNTACAVAVGPNRSQSADALVAQGCDVILADDGLQHYRMARDKEIIVVDGERLFGNEHLLPVGPLREPLSRLREVDWILVSSPPKGDAPVSAMFTVPCYEVNIVPTSVTHIASGEVRALEEISGMGSVAAVVGIGNPMKFFNTLNQLGVEYEKYIFPDHHKYTAEDFATINQKTILMTEKDAVKCKALVGQEAFCLNVEMRLPSDFLDEFFQSLTKDVQVS